MSNLASTPSAFAKLNLCQPLLKALTKCGYMQPTPIQEQAIPCVLAGKDLIATAQTGTGKTAAFVLPALQFLLTTQKQTLPQILILSPTRELAHQITDAIHKYSNNTNIKVVSILGGESYTTQLRRLSQPLDIIVATPGRLIDYMKQGKINLSQIKMLVLDEADRMLDMGFIDDVKRILTHVSPKRQTLLFTATMDPAILKFAQNILKSPEHIAISGKSTTLVNIKQRVYIADDKNHKDRLLEHLLNSESIYKSIIFSATKHYADKLASRLRDQGFAAFALHGDMNQSKRNRAIEQFRHGKTQILVATDLAARGIDISDLSHVINYDIPRAAEDYVHRIGRTGRAGKEGIAISFVLASEGVQLKRIEKYTGCTIEQTSISGLEPKYSLQQTTNKPKKAWRGRSRKPAANKNDKRGSFRFHAKKAAK